MSHTLPTLDQIQIASPCHASWDDMRGDDRVRFCGHCQLNVYNLSEMPRDEAEKLVLQREGRLCVRFFRRHDGTVLTRDCPVGIRALRQRLVRSVAAIAGLLLALIGSTAFGSRVSRWLPAGLRSPGQAFAQWVDPNPPQLLTGDMVMGGCPPPPIMAPPLPPPGTVGTIGE